MQRIIALLLVLFLSTSFVLSSAESDTEYFTMETGLTEVMAKALDYPNAKEWMSSSAYRAMISVSLLFDYTLKVRNDESASYTPTIHDLSYIARDGVSLFVLFANEQKDKVVIISYTPSKKDDKRLGDYCEYTPSDYSYTVKAFVEFMADALGPDGYYKNDAADMNEVLAMLQEYA